MKGWNFHIGKTDLNGNDRNWNAVLTNPVQPYMGRKIVYLASIQFFPVCTSANSGTLRLMADSIVF